MFDDIFNDFFKSVQKWLDKDKSDAQKTVTPDTPSSKSKSQWGRTIHSSKTLEEVEAEQGQKMYQVGEGIYVNKVAYKKRQNEKEPIVEEDPIVEEENIADFESFDIEADNALAVAWHPKTLHLAYLHHSGGEEKSVEYAVGDVIDNAFIARHTGRIEISYGYETVQHLALHHEFPYLLVICKNDFFVWDYEYQSRVNQLKFKGDLGYWGGFYPDLEHAWAIVPNGSASYDWLYWNYLDNSSFRFELEHDMYGRGATLHPSGLLIGALWNDYDNGYYIHSPIDSYEALRYYTMPVVKRYEYENRSPCFTSDGKHFAFIVYGRGFNAQICIYDMISGNLVQTINTYKKRMAIKIQFARNNSRLACHKFDKFKISDALCIFNPETGKRVGYFERAADITNIACHSIYGYYAISHKSGVTVYYEKDDDIADSSEDLASIAKDIAQEFMEKYAAYQAKPEDWGDD